MALLDVLQHADPVPWKKTAAASGCAKTSPPSRFEPVAFPILPGNARHDEVLLQADQQIADMQGKQGSKLVAFHLMGSHGPTYYRRYPAADRVFLPDCPRSDIENCSNEELVNTL